MRSRSILGYNRCIIIDELYKLRGGAVLDCDGSCELVPLMHHGKVWAPSHDLLDESIYCHVLSYAHYFPLWRWLLRQHPNGFDTFLPTLLRRVFLS